MAQSNDNVLTAGLRGSIGGQLVFRNKAGKTVVSKSPKLNPGYVPTPEQQVIRDKFTEAIRYAKAAIADATLKAGYTAKANPGQSAYNVAFQDAYNPPELSQLRIDSYNGQPQDVIRVKAVDNFKVATVEVFISKPDGSLLERGLAALEPNGSDWKYLCTQQNATLPGTVVKIVATDLAGNAAELQQTL
jgi:hypothetical protein